MYVLVLGVPRGQTQAERSAATKALLTAAALELLVERGWAATTAVAVCDRAGVTRGALLHHYSGVADLLADALRRLYAIYEAEAVPARSLVAVVDEIWSVCSDRRFKAVLEAWMAASNDPELAVSLGPVIADFGKLAHPDQRLVQVASRSASGDGVAVTFTLVARETMLGLALGRATGGGAPVPHESVVLGRLRAEAAGLDAASE
jgi:AcrR family transcriptional regulator